LFENTIPSSWTKLRNAMKIIEGGAADDSNCSAYRCEAIRKGRRKMKKN